ncbi:HDIG domain-containing protein [Prevotella cerevisiae]|uniref:HDIG domain-containing protein n=1 Tax=Segatella cerevisiae TaxID=2053716 RepID=A0ABT1C151_9BACT|nr:HDIG domain-containing metalloprotein [Segatella cerevisiae]MCO6026223.1 HDIG domain-containing protein [Segatella cerevisiae]
MNLFKKQEDHYWRDFFTRSGLVIATVAIIVWFLPRNEGRQFQYDMGKPWMYGAFIAKFDFPIYKTDETIQKEKDSLLKRFQPYYNYNAQIEKDNIGKFLTDFKGGIPGLPNGYVSLIAEQLHQLYQAGIMNTPEYNTIYKDSTDMIRVVIGKQAQSRVVNRLYSTLSAYEQLFMNERLNKERLILQRCNLNDYIEPNLIYDKSRNETEKNDLLSAIPLASGMVLSGQKIIDRGEIINDYDYRVLNSYEKEIKRRSATKDELNSTIAGQLIFVYILVMLFTLYLILFRKDYFEKTRNILMLYSMIVIFPILTSFMIKHNFLSVYIIPFALVPIFIRIFQDSRTAFVTHITMVLICAVAVKYQYEFIIVQLAAGMVAIYSLRELSNRLQVIKTALLVTLVSMAVYFSLDLMQSNEIVKIDRSMYTYFIVNGVLLLLANPLMYLIEKTFGFVSDVTLIELSNTNKGILRKLSEIAPGTFQHSITVGNLAAEIANKIGAKSLLVRTGALYHDIGKITNPVFFTENQSGVNPHEKMGYKESAQIIISHVTEGMKIAEQINLPSIVKDFIITHHGTGITRYFYVKYKNEHPDEDVDPADFQYPGPNPFTREQAILMMADTVEAASRSLTEYTEKSITDLVNKLIDGQVEQGFFKECPITFRDIAQAKQVLIERLKAIYHTRISYPELKSQK